MLSGGCRKAVFKGELYCECVDDNSRIDVYEAAYKVKKGFMEVTDENGVQLTWFEVIRRFSRTEPRAWIMFTVYNDLRERGRVVKLGPYENSFTLYVSGKPKAIIFVLEETVLLKINTLKEYLESSMKMGRECILAIVDKHGDVSYYSVGKFS